MKIVNIQAHNIPDAWFQSLWQIMQHGRNYKVERGSFEGHYRKQLDFVQIQITNPGLRPLAPDIPPGLSVEPPTSMQYIEDYFVNYLMSPVMSTNEQYTYGNRLSQSMQQVIEILKNTPETNQAIMEVGAPEDIELSDPPCLRLIDCRVMDGKLHFFIYFRSWDLWGGLPANLGGIQLVKEYMASEVGVNDGEIIAVSKGLHLYDYAWGFAEERTGRF